jgi:hypothetical protein
LHPEYLDGRDWLSRNWNIFVDTYYVYAQAISPLVMLGIYQLQVIAIFIYCKDFCLENKAFDFLLRIGP